MSLLLTRFRFYFRFDILGLTSQAPQDEEGIRRSAAYSALYSLHSKVLRFPYRPSRAFTAITALQ